ncbi:MAG: cyclic nucleotide-binding domain-containing protein [Planctomycetota bacterium]
MSTHPDEPAPDQSELPPTETRQRDADSPRDAEETVVGPPPGTPLDLDIRSRLEDRFSERGVLGRGGMGFVLRVFDANLERVVAMKIATPERLESHGAGEFVREARGTAKLEHPNVIPVHELGAYPDGRPYFVMRKIEGLSLSERIEREEPDRSPDERLQEFILILLKVCDAISYAHSRGLIHCDLKPQNIMTGSFGEVYVVDWGIARPKDAPPQRGPDGRIKWSGTPAYLAPELLRAGATGPDERTDVFGLGGILYAILTGGQAPFEGETAAESLERALVYRLDHPQTLAATALPAPLCAIALRALARDPQARYASATEMRAALESYLRGGPAAVVRHFPAGAKVFLEGERGDAAYFIAKGHCQAFRVGPNGERRVLRELGPGDVFGEMSVITAQPRTATVEATDDVTVHVIGREELAKGLAHHPGLEKIVHALTERFRELDARSSQP